MTIKARVAQSSLAAHQNARRRPWMKRIMSQVKLLIPCRSWSPFLIDDELAHVPDRCFYRW